MAISTDGTNVYENITDLPSVDEIVIGDLLIVETENGTCTIDFQNFLIGPDNTTFKDTMEDNSTNITTLSGSIDAIEEDIEDEVKAFLNRSMTVGYYLAGTGVGQSFTVPATLLPITYIQSNTIDGNFQNANATLCGITSGSNVINVNTGTYHVTIAASFSGSAVIDLYDATSNRVLLVSDYGSSPTLDGTVSFAARSSLQVRGYTGGTAYLGRSLDFSVTNMVRTPLKATFTYLSGGVANFVRPDTRS